MKKIIFLFTMLLFSSLANSYKWTTAIPTQIHIVSDGMVLIGDFDNYESFTCATGVKAVFVPKTDVNFEYKLSLALTAISTNKKITTLISDPLDKNCKTISFHGEVPVAHEYYWQLKN